MQSFNPVQIEKNIIKQKVKLKKLSHNYKINFENIEKKILIDVEEIEKLNEEIQSDLVLPKGKRVILRADNPKVNRGLIVTWLEKGGYNVEYWYKDPSKIYPAEVKIDGESITKDLSRETP